MRGWLRSKLTFRAIPLLLRQSQSVPPLLSLSTYRPGITPTPFQTCAPLAPWRSALHLRGGEKEGKTQQWVSESEVEVEGGKYVSRPPLNWTHLSCHNLRCTQLNSKLRKQTSRTGWMHNNWLWHLQHKTPWSLHLFTALYVHSGPKQCTLNDYVTCGMIWRAVEVINASFNNQLPPWQQSFRTLTCHWVLTGWLMRALL